MPNNTFTLGGHTFTSEQIITAIQESDNQNNSNSTDISDVKYNTVVDTIASLRARVEELESSVHHTAGFLVSKQNNVDGSMSVIVSMKDRYGKTVVVNFLIPADNGT